MSKTTSSDLYEDDFAFDLLRKLAIGFYTEGRHPGLFPPGNSNKFYAQLSTAHDDIHTLKTPQERQEALRLLKRYDPIMWDLVWENSGVSETSTYEVILRRLMITILTNKESIEAQYSAILEPYRKRKPVEHWGYSADYEWFIRKYYSPYDNVIDRVKGIIDSSWQFCAFFSCFVVLFVIINIIGAYVAVKFGS